MNYFSGTNPNLISPSVTKIVSKIAKQGGTYEGTVSDKILDIIWKVYNSYIKDNILVILIILIIIFMLIFRYNNIKKNRESELELKSEKFSLSENKEIDKQTSHLISDNPPHMNPLTGEDKGFDINYIPDDIEKSKGTKLKNLQKFPKIHMDESYDYNNVYTNPSRSYYNGTYNTYENAKDTSIINPYGWSNNFNTNTGKFVGYMTNENTNNMDKYNNILYNNDHMTG